MQNSANGVNGGKPPVKPRAPITFDEVRRIVVWHYQWIAIHDFLRQVVDREVLTDVLENGPRFYHPRKWAYIPVEFSGAAFRFGHSMTRESYDFNRAHTAWFDPGLRGRKPAPLTIQQLFEGAGLFGRASTPPKVPIPDDNVIDWRRFFKMGGPQGMPFNLSRNIDPFIGPS
jgi:hypothetical protein